MRTRTDINAGANFKMLYDTVTADISPRAEAYLTAMIGRETGVKVHALHDMTASG